MGKWTKQVKRDDALIKGTENDIVVPCVAVTVISENLVHVLSDVTKNHEKSEKSKNSENAERATKEL